jgi:hypothetical protein
LLDGCSTTFSVLGGDATPIALLDDCATTNAVLGGGSTPIALHDDCATTNAVLGGGSTPSHCLMIVHSAHLHLKQSLKIISTKTKI